MIEGRAVFVHMPAHDHGDLTIGTHGAEWYFEVAHIAGLQPSARVFRKWSCSADAQREFYQAGIDRSTHLAQERHRSGAARAAGKKYSRRDAENLRHLFGPKRLEMGGGDRYA